MSGWCKLPSCTEFYLIRPLVNTAFFLMRCSVYSRTAFSRINTVMRRSTTQIRVVTRYQYGISALVSQSSISRGNQWWSREMLTVNTPRLSVIICLRSGNLLGNSLPRTFYVTSSPHDNKENQSTATKKLLCCRL